MAVIALLAAAAFGASPAKLVLGKDAGADLVLRASARAHVTITASVGTVSEPGRDGDVWRARFTPPSRRAPSVALILAQVDEEGERDLHWLSIPLAGSDTMEIETRPGDVRRRQRTVRRRGGRSVYRRRLAPEAGRPGQASRGC